MDSQHENSTRYLTDSQVVALAIVPKFTAFLSGVAEIWILKEVISSKEKRKNVYHRIVAAMSAWDFFQSIGYFLSTWPIPTDINHNLYANVGNQATCTFQGLLVHLGLGSAVYFAVLCLYYNLVIRHGWSERRLLKVEKYLHIVPTVIGLGTALAGVPLKLYNEAVLWCWIASFPDECDITPDIECERGHHAKIYQFAFYFGPLWCCFACILYCLGSVYRGVRRDELKTLKYRQPHLFQHGENTPPPEPPKVTILDCLQSLGCCCEYIPKDEHSKFHQVASQSFWYVLVFFSSHIFGTIDVIWHVKTSPAPYAVTMLQAIFDPLQGFFNFLVYRRPTYLRLRKQNPKWRRAKSIVHTCRWSGSKDKRKQPTRYYQAPAPAAPPVSEKIPSGIGSGGQEGEDTFPEGGDVPTTTTSTTTDQQPQPTETTDPDLKDYVEQARRFSELADLDIIEDLDLDWASLNQLVAPPLFLVASQTNDGIRAERTEEFVPSSSSFPPVRVPIRASSTPQSSIGTFEEVIDFAAAGE
jgi:hypothetical protein